jgi:hypothetical protein
MSNTYENWHLVNHAIFWLVFSNAVSYSSWFVIVITENQVGRNTNMIQEFVLIICDELKIIWQIENDLAVFVDMNHSYWVVDLHLNN